MSVGMLIDFGTNEKDKAPEETKEGELEKRIEFEPLDSFLKEATERNVAGITSVLKRYDACKAYILKYDGDTTDIVDFINFICQYDIVKAENLLKQIQQNSKFNATTLVCLRNITKVLRNQPMKCMNLY